MRITGRTFFVFAGILVVAAFVYIAAFLPIGTGEYLNSPDGRFRAHAMNRYYGLKYHARESHVELEVEELATHRNLWRLDFYPHSPEAAVEYGDRRKKHIVWSPDSRSVTIPIAADRSITIPIP